MNHALRKSMTVDEFLAWEDQQERKWEFDGFAPVAMVGGTLEHAVIGSNIVVALQGRLRGSPCRAINSDLKIRLPAVSAIPTPLLSALRSPGAPRLSPTQWLYSRC